MALWWHCNWLRKLLKSLLLILSQPLTEASWMGRIYKFQLLHWVRNENVGCKPSLPGSLVTQWCWPRCLFCTTKIKVLWYLLGFSYGSGLSLTWQTDHKVRPSSVVSPNSCLSCLVFLRAVFWAQSSLFCTLMTCLLLLHTHRSSAMQTIPRSSGA